MGALSAFFRAVVFCVGGNIARSLLRLGGSLKVELAKAHEVKITSQKGRAAAATVLDRQILIQSV